MFLLLILCALTAFYFYIKKCNNYWKERGVLTANLNPIFGTAYDLLLGRRSIEEIHVDIYNAYPNEPYVGIYNILKPILFVRDPELIHKILVKDFSHFQDRSNLSAGAGRLVYNLFALGGEEWKFVRNKLTPTFSSSKLRKMYGSTKDSLGRMMQKHLSPSAKSKEPVDVKEVMTRFTLDVIGCCAFGLQFNTIEDSESLYRKVAKTIDFTGFMNSIRLAIQMFNPNLMKWLGLKATSDEVENFFFDLLHKAQELRKTESKHRGDFLQLMLDLKAEEENKGNFAFTEDHIASNMFAFYVAGHETTANTLAFCLYELAMHPEIQEKLRQEIKAVRQANKGVIDYDALKNLSYMEMVISETLRLHGPATISSRICTQNYQIPDSSIELKPGDQIFHSIAAIHKDEKYFPNPQEFDPERFSEENIARREHYLYHPFGDGPRICIGLRFANMEMKICLAFVLSQYKFSRCDKTEVPIILHKKGLFHTAKNGIWLTVDEIQTELDHS